MKRHSNTPTDDHIRTHKQDKVHTFESANAKTDYFIDKKAYIQMKSAKTQTDKIE